MQELQLQLQQSKRNQRKLQNNNHNNNDGCIKYDKIQLESAMKFNVNILGIISCFEGIYSLVSNFATVSYSAPT